MDKNNGKIGNLEYFHVKNFHCHSFKSKLTSLKIKHIKIIENMSLERRPCNYV
jgi:hypothetical protein